MSRCAQPSTAPLPRSMECLVLCIRTHDSRSVTSRFEHVVDFSKRRRNSVQGVLQGRKSSQFWQTVTDLHQRLIVLLVPALAIAGAGPRCSANHCLFAASSCAVLRKNIHQHLNILQRMQCFDETLPERMQTGASRVHASASLCTQPVPVTASKPLSAYVATTRPRVRPCDRSAVCSRRSARLALVRAQARGRSLSGLTSGTRGCVQPTSCTSS